MGPRDFKGRAYFSWDVALILQAQVAPELEAALISPGWWNRIIRDRQHFLGVEPKVLFPLEAQQPTSAQQSARVPSRWSKRSCR